jgi:transcriptional regulator
MYTPAAFRVQDPEWLHGFVEAHEFGLLVSAAPLQASHLPFQLIRPEGGRPARLVCHLARANPQWRAFEGAGAEAVAIFRGSHAYVSPMWYGAHPSVPTWNYDAVEARGHATVIEDRAAIEAQMAAMAARYEPRPGFEMDAQPASTWTACSAAWSASPSRSRRGRASASRARTARRPTGSRSPPRSMRAASTPAAAAIREANGFG